MLNKFGKLFILTAIFFSFAFLTGSEQVFAQKSEGIQVMTEETAQNLTVNSNSSRVKDIDIDPINTDQVKKNVIPNTKQEGKKFINLFCKTMFLVLFCGCIIYLILFFVKRFYGSKFVPMDEEYENVEMLDLLTPETKNAALKSFLNRTK